MYQQLSLLLVIATITYGAPNDLKASVAERQKRAADGVAVGGLGASASFGGLSAGAGLGGGPNGGGLYAGAGLGGGPNGGGLYAGAGLGGGAKGGGLYAGAGLGGGASGGGLSAAAGGAGGSASAGAGARVDGSGSAGGEGGFFDKVFNIPISVLQAVNTHLNNKGTASAEGNVAVRSETSVQGKGVRKNYDDVFAVSFC
ncbi:hypothetical protein O3M35_006880 [Rhynocoris fuscipes]|uniref:Uncharacterized protein n=1 Tax=Rhynocoris fuscipes TaxID=488301 RepID=A0AAW1DMA4_9HEMI